MINGKRGPNFGEQVSDSRFNHLVKKCNLHKNIRVDKLKEAITKHRTDKGLLNKIEPSVFDDPAHMAKVDAMKKKRRKEKMKIRNMGR